MTPDLILEANNANRLLEELEPYLAEIEAELFGKFKTCLTEDSLLEVQLEARAVERIRQKIKTKIDLGRQASVVPFSAA
jgi:hypothetical protein